MVNSVCNEERRGFRFFYRQWPDTTGVRRTRTPARIWGQAWRARILRASGTGRGALTVAAVRDPGPVVAVAVGGRGPGVGSCRPLVGGPAQRSYHGGIGREGPRAGPLRSDRNREKCWTSSPGETDRPPYLEGRRKRNRSFPAKPAPSIALAPDVTGSDPPSACLNSPLRPAPSGVARTVR